MPNDVLEIFIQQYIEGQEVETVNFTWQGGEPALAGLGFFEKVIELQAKYSNGKKIENAFQTNGMLLNDKWCEFFAKNTFLVGISIDGPKYLHDFYRTGKTGKSTFDSVINGIYYLKKHNVEFNTLAVVNRKNSYHSLEVYNFLKEIGSRYMQFIPAVEKRSFDIQNNHLNPIKSMNFPTIVSEWSVESEQYGNFLCEIFDYWVKNDVGKYFVQTFDVALESWCQLPSSLCIFAETCGSALAIEHNGDLYSCDHYVLPKYFLGNVQQQELKSLVYSYQQQKFGNDKRDTLPKFCKKCDFKFACNGGCPKNRFITSPDGEPDLNYLCHGYKKFFSHIAPYMHFMENELGQQRPPANVMRWNSNNN